MKSKHVFVLVLFFIQISYLWAELPDVIDGYKQLDIISVSTSKTSENDITGYMKNPQPFSYVDTLYFKIYIEGNLSGNVAPLNVFYYGGNEKFHMLVSNNSKFFKYFEPTTIYKDYSNRVKGFVHYYAIKIVDLPKWNIDGSGGSFYFRIYDQPKLADWVVISIQSIKSSKIRISAPFEGSGTAYIRVNYVDNSYSTVSLKMFSSDLNNIFNTKELLIKDIQLIQKAYGGNRYTPHVIYLNDKKIGTFLPSDTTPIKWSINNF